jgi:hypothetical protein
MMIRRLLAAGAVVLGAVSLVGAQAAPPTQSAPPAQGAAPPQGARPAQGTPPPAQGTPPALGARPAPGAKTAPTAQVAQGPVRPLSPDATSSAQILGRWVQGAKQEFTLGRGSYVEGKWIDISYGRPLKRGRDLWGTGPTYGQDLLVDAPIWRAGANVTTQLTSDVPLIISGHRLAPGKKYAVFVDVKEGHWTFVLSTLTAQAHYDPKNKTDVWGGYNYVSTDDILRAPMTLETLPHAFEELSWQFIDMTKYGGSLALVWDNVIASVPFIGG